MSQTESGLPLIVDQQAVKKALPHLDVRLVLAQMFRALGDDMAVQPPQTLTLFPKGAGDFITYLGVMADAKVFGAKLSPYIVTEAKPVITAWTALMSMETGQPLMWCDSGQLTIERTAGATALAVEHLAADAAGRLAIIGAGASWRDGTRGRTSCRRRCGPARYHRSGCGWADSFTPPRVGASMAHDSGVLARACGRHCKA